MNKEILKYIFTDFQERKLPNTKARSQKLPLAIEKHEQALHPTNKIISLVGVRRSGKTYLLFHTIKRLLDAGIKKKNIIYLNFEDDRLFPIKLSELDLILKSYYELFPEKINEKKFMFFDEIQNVQNWEKYIRRIYDTENVQIFITGSSSKLLSRDISTSLRGRSISYEVLPLSFKEYLDLYFILKDYYSLKEISKRAKEIFQGFFNQKLFREQLSYFNDVDYSEDIEYIKETINKNEIKNFLIDVATAPF